MTRNMGKPDMSRVDDLAVEFACNGTPMRLNQDERIVAVQRMLGTRASQEIARLVCTYGEEIGRIAKRTEGTLVCPYCRQRAYADDGVFRTHVDSHGRQWCPQSGHHKDVRQQSIESLSRSGQC